MAIAPSSLFVSTPQSGQSASDQTYFNTQLRMGVVLKAYEIDDPDNTNKSVPEYDVMAIEQEGTRGVNSTIYKNCVVFDGFGGVADFFQMKLRPVKDQKKTRQKLDFEGETGSIVLMLCIDGNADSAMIIKGMSNPSKKVLTKEKGIHLEGEYNGINYQVNKDGELTVTFRSATNDDGTPKDEKAGGSFFKIDKTGSFELNDDNKDSIKIDKTEQTITLNSEKDTNIVTNSNLNITSKDNTNIKATDLIANAEGRIAFNSKSPSVFKCEADLTLEAPTVKIQGTDMVMAQANQIQLLGNQVIVGNAAVPAIVPPTIFLGIGNLGGIVVSTSIGPYSSSVLVGL